MAAKNKAKKKALTLKAKPVAPVRKMTSAELADHLVIEIENWFTNKIVENNKKAIRKMSKASSFEINRYLVPYVAQARFGKITAEAIARSLIEGRAMVTSLNTSFGTGMQRFITNEIKAVVGSAIAGIDIEFEDCIDGRKKYAQVKAGVATINKDDVNPIVKKFKAIRSKARLDGVRIAEDETVLCVIYGEASALNTHYLKMIDEGVEVYVGNDFWQRLTGEKNMEERLFQACRHAASKASVKPLLDKAVAELALDPAIVALVP